MSAINRLFRAQHGVITINQARRAGLSPGQIERRVKSGEWRRSRNGVFIHSAVQPTLETELVAATIGRRAVVSGPPATWLWGLELFERPKPEITVAGGFQPTKGVVTHRTVRWDLVDRQLRRGIPVTGIERTVVDLASLVPIGVVERAAEAAIRRNLTSWTSIAQCHGRHGTNGRKGAGELSSLLDSRLGRPVVTRSDFSNLVLDLLRRNGLPEPVVEHVVRDRSGRYILAVDLAWPDLRRAWELDSRGHHFDVPGFERDRSNWNRLVAAGWSLQIVTWKQFTGDPDGIVEMARAFVIEANAA